MPQAKPASHQWRSALGVCGFLLAAVWLIYGQTLSFGFLKYDDNGFVYDHPQITAGLTSAGIRWAMVDGPYGEWYPLAVLSEMLDCQLYGLDACGHHLTNVLLHAAASVGLFLVWWQMTGRLWPSALVATLFAAHPQHVESVAWISERRDVLSGLFFVLVLGAFLGYVRRGRPVSWYVLVAVPLALGLMSKAMLVTVPPLLLLLDYWPLTRIGSASAAPAWTCSIQRPGVLWLLLEKLPLAALAAADCWITMRTHYAVPTVWQSGWQRIGNAAISCVTYIVQFVYPVNLAAIYPLSPSGPPAWRAIGAVVALAAVTVAAVVWRRRCPYVFVGWFWFLGMLLPVLGIVRLADHAMADRYMYLPSIGLSIALVWGAEQLAVRLALGRWLLAGAAGSAVAMMMFFAFSQTMFWRDDEALWTHALECTTSNAAAETALGVEMARRGQHDQAIPLFVDALAINPGSAHSHLMLGASLTLIGQFDGAAEHINRALEIEPKSVRAYVKLGVLRSIEHQYDRAHEAFQQALAIEPDNAATHNDFGSSYFLQGKIEEAIAEYNVALAIDPNLALGHVNLADALAVNGQTQEAERHYRSALKIDPANRQARQQLDALRNADHPPPAR